MKIHSYIYCPDYFYSDPARYLYSSYINNVDDINISFNFSSKYFSLFSIYDKHPFFEEEIKQIIKWLIPKGAVCFDFWGSHCNKIHDICDDVIYSSFNNDPIFTSSWDNYTLERALWSAIYVSSPDESYKNDYNSVLALTFGKNQHHKSVIRWLNNLKTLKTQILYREESPKHRLTTGFTRFNRGLVIGDDR